MTEHDERDPLGDLEVPVEDALEQRAEAVERVPDDDRTRPDGLEADEADLAEQSRVLDPADDEYR